jgi:hypothetical protein
MDLKNKLKGLPPVYYVNLDNRTDRREYMETQFDYWGIKDYHRVSGTKYLASKIDDWKDKFIGDVYGFENLPQVTANSITHLEMIKNWLETTNEPYMIMMEDDYDLSLIEYWNFDWEYLMNHIPYDWDCIQLGFESKTYIHFFLHPKLYCGTYFGPCLIHRDYAKKLIKLHYIENKINLNMKTNNFVFINEGNSLSVDYFICENGRTYCIPLITCNNDLGSYEDNFIGERFYHNKSRELYYDWWKNEHHKFTLEDFFTYGKPNDYKMIKDIRFNTLNIENIKKKLTYR